jgi:hypothetical protein
MNCHACGTALAATARFCHKCGAPVGAAQAAGWRAGLPWGIAGAALGALVVVLALRSSGGTARPTPEAPTPIGQTPMAAPDISQMSPEERATRLYNRVMTLHAAGKRDSAEFFLPMALQAYAMLPALDIDARYHVGVLHLTAGDGAGALAQADSIDRLVSTHLFGFMLRARALETQNHAREALQAYRDFLRNEPAERARQRPEYAEHAQNLDAFHEQAISATGGRRKTSGS